MEKLVVVLLSIVLVALVGFAVYAGVTQAKWISQHCQKMGEISSSTGYATTFNNGTVGYGQVYIPGKTGYKCDDGIERWE